MRAYEPGSRDAPAPPAGSGVTFVMPVLNEADYLEPAVRSVLAQDLDEPFELVLALGPSTDGTTALAHELARQDERVRIVDNPRADIPVGLNLAIRSGRFATIVRVDAHSELDTTYARAAMATLERVGAANVGGVMRAAGRTPFQRAVARAYNSRIGLGGGAYHGGQVEGPAESAYLGVMRRAVLEEVGLFDETIRRGEDWELNLRIRKAGYRVWFDPALAVTYWPRESWARLARQFLATGTWRGELVHRYGASNSPRYFAPGALVLTTIGAVISGIARMTGLLRGRPARVLGLLWVPVLAYAAIIVGAAAGRWGGHTVRDKLWTAAVLPTMHLAWGTGFLIGSTGGADDTIDTSRLDRKTPLP